MKLRYIIPAAVLGALMTAGIASAQSAVAVTTTQVTSAITAGANVYLGSVAITGPLGSTLTAVPISVNPGGGASNSQLSNCQLYNSTGASVTTGSNVVSSIGGGQNVFNLNTPMQLNANALTLTLRCNVASGIPSGATFTINTATPITTATPPFVANLDIAPSVPAGAQDVTLANISFGTGAGTAVNIASIPVTVTAANGASVANLSDCRIRNTTNLSGSLSGTINPTGGTTVFNLAGPFAMQAGTTGMLAFTCDVSAATPVGGTFTVSVNPSSVVATNASTGASIAPTAVAGIGPNNLPAATSGAIIVSAVVSGTPPADPGAPGVPNTGAGGGAQTALILALSALIALAGAAYLKYQIR